MKLEIRELVLVDYINEEEDFGEENSERYTVYESDKENFLEAINDYHENFNFDKIITCHDVFDGSCLEVIDIMSARILEEDEEWSALAMGLGKV